jgi:hypothetical protein
MSRAKAQKQSSLGALRRAKVLRRALRQEKKRLVQMTVVNEMYQQELDERTRLLNLLEALNQRTAKFIVDQQEEAAVPAEDPEVGGPREDHDSSGDEVGGAAELDGAERVGVEAA